mgnify:FL=1|jgi:acyl carrier protein
MEKDIINVIAEIAEINPKKISMASTLSRDLELESLDLVTLVSTLEKKFDVSVNDNDIKDLQTVGDIINYVKEHL